MDCPFCSLDPSEYLVDAGDFFVIYDKYPVTKGHMLVIPRKHIQYVQDLPYETWVDMMWYVKAMAVDDFNIGINNGPAAGQTVPHLHIHVIPRTEGDVEDPRGGVRWVNPSAAKYWKD